ncbi:MAG: PqqD family protein [Chloroflexi bacterium]|nr:MAG: PqqD family protein [Chloroflexota bacterium]
MQPTDVLTRSPHAAHQTLGEEAVLINVNSGDTYSLNDTGTMFWELLDGRRTVADCARAIAAEYDVTADVVEADLLELAAEFAAEGLAIVA